MCPFSGKVIEQNEAKLSKIKDDLVNTKEQLNQTVLAKEVLEQEKREVGKYFLHLLLQGILYFHPKDPFDRNFRTTLQLS